MRVSALAPLLALLAHGESRRPETPVPEIPGPQTQGTATRPDDIRRMVAPDGSVFLLAPTGGAPVVFLAMATACGPADEPPGLEGLSLAVERASFRGTPEIGGRDWPQEEAILREEDGLCGEAARLRLAGKEPGPELLAKIAAVRVRADARGDPSELRRRLNELAASDPRIGRCPDGTLVTMSFPLESFGAVLELIRVRRDRACLRGFHREFERVREELGAEELADPHRRSRREVLTLAFKQHPYRRVLDSALGPPIPCDRSQALAFFQAHHEPGSTVTVLSGGFDLAAAEVSIRAAHRDKGGVVTHPAEQAPDPEQEGERIGQLPTSHPELLCIGFRIPRSGAPRTHRDVLAKLLGGGPASILWKRLVEQGVATGGDVRPSFPGSRDLGLFVIDVVLTPGRSPETARDEVFRMLSMLAEQGPNEPDLDRAKAEARSEVVRKAADPESLAALLAIEALGQGALGPGSEAASVNPKRLAEEYGAITGSALRETAAALFKPGRRTVVFSLPEGSGVRK